jgi:hypothetical protein
MCFNFLFLRVNLESLIRVRSQNWTNIDLGHKFRGLSTESLHTIDMSVQVGCSQTLFS